MKILAQFSNRSPLQLDGAWRIVIEIEGVSYEVVSQMVDKGEPNLILRANDLGAKLLIIPHGANSIRFGAK